MQSVHCHNVSNDIRNVCLVAGYCHVGWALYMTAGAAGITIACSFLSCCASRHKSTTYHM